MYVSVGGASLMRKPAASLAYVVCSRRYTSATIARCDGRSLHLRSPSRVTISIVTHVHQGVWQVQCGRISDQQGSLARRLRRQTSRPTVGEPARYGPTTLTQSVAELKKLIHFHSTPSLRGNRSQRYVGGGKHASRKFNSSGVTSDEATAWMASS